MSYGGVDSMSYNCIRIERERSGFSVHATDPAIEKANRERDRKSDTVSDWKDPSVEFTFETKEQVLAFVDKAMDIALPADAFSTAFDRIAKEAQKA